MANTNFSSAFTSENLCSDVKKEGIKYITQAVYDCIKELQECTYQQIVDYVHVKNNETKVRRIYDVLNVLRAVNLIDKKLSDKKERIYFLLDTKDELNKKKIQLAKLKKMKETFKFITERNKKIEGVPEDQKLYMPFMVIHTDKNADISCTPADEGRSFGFVSNKPLYVMDDLNILIEIMEKKPKKNPKTELTDFYL